MEGDARMGARLKTAGVAIALLSVVLLVLAGRAGRLSPYGKLLALVLACAFVFWAAALAGARRLPVRLLSAFGALMAGIGLGVWAVNHYYAYYTSWSALISDLSADNSVAGAADVPIDTRRADGGVTPIASGAALGPGRLESISLPGPVSGLNGRHALVWLPPQYDQSRYASTRFPVLVLLHGEPGHPQGWTSALGLPEALNKQYASGTSNPMVVIMPDVNGRPYQECLDAPRAPRIDTYLATDVPAGIGAQLRVAPPGRQWAVGGLSSGGFCAAHLALKHPDTFGAAAVMDGYFHPELNRIAQRELFGPAPVPAEDDPTTLLARFPTERPLPAFWIMGGTGNASDYRKATAFATSVRDREDLRFLTVLGGQHRVAAWRASLPDLLLWAAAVVNDRPASGQTAIHV